MSAFTLYMLMIVDRLHTMSSVIATILFMGLCIGAVVTSFEDSFRTFIQSKVTRAIVIGLFVFTLLAVLLPTRTEIAIILGVSYTTQIEGAEQLPENVMNLLNKYIEEAIPTKEE